MFTPINASARYRTLELGMEAYASRL